MNLVETLNKKINGELTVDKYVLTVQIGVNELRREKLRGCEKKSRLRTAMQALVDASPNSQQLLLLMQTFDDLVDALVYESARCPCF